MITNVMDIPKEFKSLRANPKMVNLCLNNYGPIYEIRTKKNIYLTQDRGKKLGGWEIYDSNDNTINELDLMTELGIEKLGIGIGDLINSYIDY
jgi:hypothetical protein